MINHIKILEQTLSKLEKKGLDMNNLTPQNIKEIFPVLDTIPLVIWITDRITPIYLNTKGRAFYNFTLEQIKREKSGIYAHYLHSDTFHKINIGGKLNDETNAPDNCSVSFFKVINGKQDVKWMGNISYLLSHNTAIDNKYMLHLTYDADDSFGRVMASFKNSNISSDDEIPVIKEREYDVLELMCKEYTSKEIADELYMSKDTVNYHRKSLMDKLNAKTSIGVAVNAIKAGLI